MNRSWCLWSEPYQLKCCPRAMGRGVCAPDFLAGTNSAQNRDESHRQVIGSREDAQGPGCAATVARMADSN